MMKQNLLGLSQGKAYVKGYEIEKHGTTFVDLDKAREFETQKWKYN